MQALAAVLLFEASAVESDPSVANWHSSGTAAWPMRLALGDKEQAATVTCLAEDHFAVNLEETRIEIQVIDWAEDSVRFTAGGLQQSARYVFAGGQLYLDLAGVSASFTDKLHAPPVAGQGAGEAQLLAPMNGRIVSVLAKAGDKVSRGQRIVILEAMKMQHEIAAQRDGTIDQVAVKEGDQVATRQLLVALAAKA